MITLGKYVNMGTIQGVTKKYTPCLRKTTITSMKINIFERFKNQKNRAVSGVLLGFVQFKLLIFNGASALFRRQVCDFVLLYTVL